MERSAQSLNGILWILRTGAPWQDLPERYGAYQTVHRRFQRWRKQGVVEAVLRGFARDLHERGGLDLSECFLDGTKRQDTLSADHCTPWTNQPLP